MEKVSDLFRVLQNAFGLSIASNSEQKTRFYKVFVLTSLFYSGETSTLYKHQVKTSERFHQRCLQQILCIGWQSHFLDTKVLERAGLPSIESMVVKNYLPRAGHVVRMDESRLLKQLFYSEMCEGKRKELRPKKRLKDAVKCCRKQFSI